MLGHEGSRRSRGSSEEYGRSTSSVRSLRFWAGMVIPSSQGACRSTPPCNCTEYAMSMMLVSEIVGNQSDLKVQEWWERIPFESAAPIVFPSCSDCWCPADALLQRFVQRFVPITISDIGRLPSKIMHKQGWSCNHQHLGYSYTTIHEPRYVLSLPNIDLGVHIDLVLGGWGNWFPAMCTGCISHEARIQMDDFPHRGRLDVLHFLCHVEPYFFLDLLPSDMHLIEITPQLRNFPWQLPYMFFPARMPLSWEFLLCFRTWKCFTMLHLMVFDGLWMFSACRKPSLGPGHKLMSTSLSSPSRFRKIQRCMAQED